KNSARNEFDALLAASEEEMATNALIPDNEDSLTVLEKAYTAAEVRVENLCDQAARMLANRMKVESWPEPQRTHTLAAADKALLENSAELEEAKSAALIAQNRVKTLKATRKALLPAPALTAVPYDPALPFHAAIKRYFKITDIPTDPKTGEVHWVSIGGLADKGAPVLNLESSLKKASADTLVTFVVRVVNAFLEQFEKYYRDKVGELFPYLAWHYMVAALVPSDLQDLYADVIQPTPVAERDWDYVINVVEKIINIDDVRHHVKALLFQLRIEHEEPALSFVTRVRRIIRMAKAQDMGHHLSELIFQALPTNGREMVNQEFPGGISKLTDYDSLLNFLSRTASAFHGRRTQPGIYIAQQWAPHALLNKKRAMDDNPTFAGPPNKRPKVLHNISSGTTAIPGRLALSAKPASSAKLASSATPAQSDPPCTHPLCKQLPAEAMASHLNSKCLRKIPDRKAWIALIKQHQPLVDQIKASGIWPGPHGQTAKPTVSAISTLSVPAIAPKAKKPKS
ncbi:hypothetical protein EC991_010774, partial [Linnemannia zychae]